MNKYRFLFIAILMAGLSSCGSKMPATTTNTAKPQTKFILPAQWMSTPDSVSFVTDDEGIYTSTQTKKTDSLLRTFEKSNLISIKVITINNTSVTADNFDQNNQSLLENWAAMHRNNEKCMVISISKNLHRIRIDYGTFVLGLLSNEETQSIIENQFKPLFKQDHFYEGTLNGLNAIMNTIRKNIKF